jgi:hypothetical protein
MKHMTLPGPDYVPLVCLHETSVAWSIVRSASKYLSVHYAFYEETSSSTDGGASSTKIVTTQNHFISTLQVCNITAYAPTSQARTNLQSKIVARENTSTLLGEGSE